MVSVGFAFVSVWGLTGPSWVNHYCPLSWFVGCFGVGVGRHMEVTLCVFMFLIVLLMFWIARHGSPLRLRIGSASAAPRTS